MPDQTGPSASTVPFPTASWGRRILALFVDWIASTLVVIVFVGLDEYGEPGSPAQFYTLGGSRSRRRCSRGSSVARSASS